MYTTGPAYLDPSNIFAFVYSIPFFVWQLINSPQLHHWLDIIWNVFFVLTIIFLLGIFYFFGKIDRLRKEQEIAIYGSKEEPIIPKVLPAKNDRWEKIKKSTDSDNPSDWNVAVIEADKMLDDMLTVMGKIGASVGDKLKTIESSDFLTLNEAWEAHKVRNKIAHENEFVLTKREAKSAINMYEKVFQEFDYI